MKKTYRVKWEEIHSIEVEAETEEEAKERVLSGNILEDRIINEFIDGSVEVEEVKT